MKTVSVSQLVGGEDAITLDDGQRVFDEIHAELDAGHDVELDFANVSVFASPFFNAAIGQLLGRFEADFLNLHLKVTELSQIGEEILRQVIENAQRFYTARGEREAQEEVLNSAAENN